MKLIKFGDKDIKNQIYDCYTGEIMKLCRHTIASKVSNECLQVLCSSLNCMQLKNIEMLTDLKKYVLFCVHLLLGKFVCNFHFLNIYFFS